MAPRAGAPSFSGGAVHGIRSRPEGDKRTGVFGSGRWSVRARGVEWRPRRGEGRPSVAGNSCTDFDTPRPSPPPAAAAGSAEQAAGLEFSAILGLPGAVKLGEAGDLGR